MNAFSLHFIENEVRTYLSIGLFALQGGIHHRYDRAKFELKTHKFDLATEQAARTEKLLQEQAG